MSLALAAGAVLLGVAATTIAYLGWRAVLRDSRLRGRPIEDLRSLTKSAPGRVALLLVVVALVAGVVIGVTLGGR